MATRLNPAQGKWLYHIDLKHLVNATPPEGADWSPQQWGELARTAAQKAIVELEELNQRYGLPTTAIVAKVREVLSLPVESAKEGLNERLDEFYKWCDAWRVWVR